MSPRRPALPWAVFLMLLPCAGCVVSEKSDIPGKGPIGKPPTGPIVQVHCFWNKQLMLVNQGESGARPLAGISGRVYFFGQEVKYPYAAQGNCRMVAEITYKGLDGKTQPVRYEFQKREMDAVLSRDSLGWGYTVPLPMPWYRPGIKEVAIKVTFLPEAGGSIVSGTSQFNLERPGTVQGVARQVPIVPGDETAAALKAK
jgi:hypothetical protein